MAEDLDRQGNVLVVERRAAGQIAVVTLSRPEARNAISREMAARLRATCQTLGEDRGLRAVVVTGSGERAFCAGADLAERRRLAPEARSAHTAEVEQAAQALADLPIPTIAAVCGYALGGGAELAIACDLRVAGSDAVFGFPEVRVGIFPGAGGLLRLPPLVGPAAAKDLLFTGRRVGAQEAMRMGLVDRVVEPPAVVDRAMDLAAEIAANAPLAVRAIKHALRAIAGSPPDAATATINPLRASLDGTEDYEEGLAAFAERREPRFTGR